MAMVCSIAGVCDFGFATATTVSVVYDGDATLRVETPRAQRVDPAPVAVAAGWASARSVGQGDFAGTLSASSAPRFATDIAPGGRQCSVGFEMQLDVADFGRRRSVHFNRANEALDEVLRADADLAARMESMIPGISGRVSSAGGRQNPVDWTWHHAESSTTGGTPGVMQLVPVPQHTPGSMFQSALHPEGAGGYAEWAIPNGAPKN